MVGTDSDSSRRRRLLRFASIEGIARADLPIAFEVWSNDLASSSWSTREMLKLANQFALYIADPDPDRLSFRSLEGNAGLDRDMVRECLRSFAMFGAVNSYDVETYSFTALLNLTYMQRLKVLELRARFAELSHVGFDDPMPWHPKAATSLTPNVEPNDNVGDEAEPRVKAALSELAERLMSQRGAA